MLHQRLHADRIQLRIFAGVAVLDVGERMLSFNDPIEPAVNVLIFIVNPFLQEFVHRSFDPLFRLGPLDNLTLTLVLFV